MEESDVVVVFEGLKYFDCYQKKLDVSIINHTEFLCLEVIVFGNGRESKTNVSRMYIDAELLLTKIDLRMFNDTLFIRQNSLRRLKQTVEISTLNKSISMNMMVNILISRLLIHDVDKSGCYEIYFQHYENDYGELKYREDGEVYAELDFQFDGMPDGLVPYSPLESRSEGSLSARSASTKCSPYKQSPTRVRKIKVLSNGLNSEEFVPEPRESQFKLFKMFAKVHPDDNVFNIQVDEARSKSPQQVVLDSTTSTDDGEGEGSSHKQQPRRIVLQHASTAPMMAKIKPQSAGARLQVAPLAPHPQLSLSVSDPGHSAGASSKCPSPHSTPRSAEFIIHRDKQLQREATLYHKMIVKPMRMLSTINVIRTSQEQPIL